jgi:hypothetical protein
MLPTKLSMRCDRAVVLPARPQMAWVIFKLTGL